MVADDGAVVLKFWMHLDKAAQKKRLEALEWGARRGGG